MISPALVQADVIDIRKAGAAIPSDLVVDANVLYWVFYGNFPSLSYAGGRLPLSYQLADYPRYWQRATGAGTRFHAIAAALGEFATTAEYAELEAIWLTDSPRPHSRQAPMNAPVDAEECEYWSPRCLRLKRGLILWAATAVSSDIVPAGRLRSALPLTATISVPP
jgi:hypothetical protein